MTRLLRLAAVAIAVAAAIDPALTVSSASRPRLAIVMLPGAGSAGDAVRERLIRELATAFEVVPELTSDAAAAVVIGDRMPDLSLPDSLLVGTVTLPDAAGQGVRIVRTDAPRDVPPATVIHLDVLVEARGLSGQTTEVTAAIAGLDVGSASHRWTANSERWRAGLDVVPVGEPPYAIRVRVKPDPAGPKQTTTDDAASTVPVVSGVRRTVADVVVNLRRTPFRVEFYEPRPSWATTFVRRALESDARFQVAALSFTSRGVSVQSGGAVPLSDSGLDDFDLVIVGGLDRLSDADARSLERYMRERGGAVVALPDQRIEFGAARDLILGHPLTERLLEQPAKLSVTPPLVSLEASELLVLGALGPGGEVIARIPAAAGSSAPGAPVIATMPQGEGRLLLSGAMDAWRFRAADDGAFDRFWQSTLAGLALAVSSPIAIDVDLPLLQPGGTAAVTVRVRARDVGPISAALDRESPIRLLPDPETGVFRGRLAGPGRAGRAVVEVRVAGARPLVESRTLLVQPDVHLAREGVAPSLNLLASSHRGIDVAPEDLQDLERFLRVAIAPPRVPLVTHPMRSTWWMLPFVLCLSLEWWRRRRRGLR